MKAPINERRTVTVCGGSQLESVEMRCLFARVVPSCHVQPRIVAFDGAIMVLDADRLRLLF